MFQRFPGIFPTGILGQKDGQIYSQTQAASQIGVSRTPMRDALQRLEQEGYIEIIPSKGFQLKPITVDGIFLLLLLHDSASTPSCSLCRLIFCALFVCIEMYPDPKCAGRILRFSSGPKCRWEKCRENAGTNIAKRQLSYWLF